MSRHLPRARYGRSDRRRRERSRGVAVVEAAFAFPVVVLITFAVIEFGLIYMTESTTVSSSQAGARLGAATVPLEPTPADAYDAMRDEVVDTIDAMSSRGTPDQLWIYRADADGTPVGVAGFGNCNTDCRAYTWNGTTFANPIGNWTNPDACIAGGLDSVGVYITVRHDLVSGLLFESVDIEEHTTNQLEPLPTDQCPTPGP